MAFEGLVALVEDRREDALERLTAAAVVGLESHGPTSEALRLAWPEAVSVCFDLGRAAETAALVDLVATQPPGHVAPYLRAQLARARGLPAAVQGEHDAVEDHLREATARLRELGYAYWLARTRTDPAVWLIDQGRGTEAAEALEAAVDVLARLRAAPALARARALQDAPAAAPSAASTSSFHESA
jgi:hypothetical protein